MLNIPERIYIIGDSGSGKTTVAKKLSEQLGHPHIDLDHIRYPKGREKLTHQESLEAAEKIANQQKWIAEGIYLYWVGSLLEKADHIVWVDTPKNIAVFRILKRHFINRIKGTETHGLIETMRFAYGARKQHDNSRTELGENDGEISPIVIERTLNPFNDKLVRIRNKEDFQRYLTQLSPVTGANLRL